MSEHFLQFLDIFFLFSEKLWVFFLLLDLSTTALMLELTKERFWEGNWNTFLSKVPLHIFS